MDVFPKKPLFIVISMVLLNCVLILLFDFLSIRTSILKTALIFLILSVYLLKYRQQTLFLSIRNNEKRPLFFFIFIFITFIICNLGIDITSLTYNHNRLLKWLWTNAATAFYEELLLRGVCLIVLLKAFAKSKTGVLFSIFFQAFIFGVIHFVNLQQYGLLYTVTQVLFATLVGFILGVLVVYYMSLWPAILVHFGNNSFSSLHQYFGGSGDELPVSILLIVCVLLTLLCSFIIHKQTPKELMILQKRLKVE